MLSFNPFRSKPQTDLEYVCPEKLDAGFYSLQIRQVKESGGATEWKTLRKGLTPGQSVSVKVDQELDRIYIRWQLEE